MRRILPIPFAPRGRLSLGALGGLLASAAALGALGAACASSSSSSGDDDGAGAQAAGAGGSHAAGAAGSGNSGNSATGGSGAGGGGGGAVSYPICQHACSTPSDCDLGILPNDADNYSCSQGYCHYLGCNSDPECQSIGNYLCRDTGLGGPSCVQACTTAASCVVSGAGAAYDLDNYSCPQGSCQYLGCNSDPECQSLGSYVCRDVGGGVRFCMPACSSPASCSFGSLPNDADNYACTDGWCRYQGCNSDTECQTMGDYVCR
jgi:hypothetical protein